MYRVGVDLGGTNIAVGIVDESLNIIGRAKMKTNSPRPAEQIFADINTCVRNAVQEAGVSMDEILSVGVGTPGSVNKDTGMIEYANNLEFNMVPAKQMLEALIGKPVYLENDANCAALGEAVAGAGKGEKNFVAITLGTGVGSGVIVDGKVISGVNYAGGEIGHMVISFDGELCTCGRRGCWESYASARALVQMTKDAMRKDQDSVMWKLADDSILNVNGRTAFDGMRAGDASAKAVVNQYIRNVSIGIINIINIFQPAMVCVGGGISNEGETLMEPLRKFVERERYSLYAEKQTKLVAAELANDAGIIGSALLDA